MDTVRTVEKGEPLFVKGPARITVKTGRIRIDGADRSRYIVKEGKTCRVEGVQQSQVEINLGSGGKIEKSAVVIPRMWLKYSHDILQESGVVMVIGAPDTGKTTFATFLVNQAVEKGKSVAVIDSDIGQSDIGPPSTIGLACVQHAVGDLSDLPADEFYFVGTTSVQDVCDMVLGLQYLVKKARETVDIVVIDTCGYVLGDKGRKLKLLKLQAVNPDVVVALQRTTELHPIVRNWGGTLVQVAVLKEVKRVPRHIRKEIRESRWRTAFKDIQERHVDLEEKKLFNTYVLSGNPVDTRVFKKLLQCHVVHAEEIPEGFFVVKKDKFHEYQPPKPFSGDTLKILDAGWEENLVVGLQKEGKFVDIGIVKRINYQNMMAVISCREHDFDAIKFGRIKVDESGCEQGFIDWC